MTLAARLDRHSIPEPNSGCLLWIGCVDAGGYGRVQVDGGSRAAHRVAFAVANGVSLESAPVVRHTCDVRSCINPLHLLAGTQADNVADAVARGRQRGALGARNCKAKLTADEVRGIRAAAGTQTDIAKRFSVRQQTVGRIRNGRIWRNA